MPQKARLSRMIPSLIGGLRAGCTYVARPAERSTAFFEALYQLAHDRDASPRPAAPAPIAVAAAEATPTAAAAQSTAVAATPDTARKAPFDQSTSTISSPKWSIGTWINFRDGDSEVPARLLWVSPLRTQYIFTTRGRGRAPHVHAGGVCWRLGAAAGDADRRTGAVVRPRGQRRARHPRGKDAGRECGERTRRAADHALPRPPRLRPSSAAATMPTFQLDARERVGLIGRNGTGKSSLLARPGRTRRPRRRRRLDARRRARCLRRAGARARRRTLRCSTPWRSASAPKDGC